MDDSTLIDAASLSKLRWRCRRGLLENDLLIERFFANHAAGVSVRQARALNTLMDLSDNDLLDLLLRRQEPKGALACAEVVDLLAVLRTPAHIPCHSPSPQEVA